MNSEFSTSGMCPFTGDCVLIVRQFFQERKYTSSPSSHSPLMMISKSSAIPTILPTSSIECGLLYTLQLDLNDLDCLLLMLVTVHVYNINTNYRRIHCH